MIHAAIMQLASQLNVFLKRTCDLNEDMVVVSNISEQDGNLAPHVNDRLVMFLVNIEKDTTPYQTANHVIPMGERSGKTSPPLFINLYLMVAGNFSGGNYPEALKFISHSISFFQRQPLFDHQNTPDLDDQIHQLTVEIANLDFHALSNLWGILSGKYLPSVLYKVRLMAFDAEDIIQQVGSITTPVTSINTQG